MVKVAFVGAGSTEFTRMLLADLLARPELAELEVALHDIAPDRLATAEAVARLTATQTGTGPRISAHPDRKGALDGADFVINTVAVGGHRATALDHRIPLAHGVRQTIGDTLGIGGIFRALRTIPVLRGIAGDMAELCPQAWLLNYTNPMAMLCWSLYADGRHERVLGLCHSIPNTIEKLAGLTGVPFGEVGFLAGGVNHQSFVLRMDHRGTDLYPVLDAAIAADPELARTVRVELYRRFGYFPTESSEHSAEYLPWFLSDEESVTQFRLRVGEYVEMSEENLAEFRRTKALVLGREADPAELGPVEHGNEFAPRVIQAMHTGRTEAIYGNVRNTGLITNLPEGSCVEVPCLVDGSGVHPIPIGALPPQLAALNRTYLSVCELTVLAALEGNREHVYHAAMLDPNTAASLPPSRIRTLCDELLAAHGDLLPEGVAL